jgi:hypothetical protein
VLPLNLMGAGIEAFKGVGNIQTVLYSQIFGAQSQELSVGE